MGTSGLGRMIRSGALAGLLVFPVVMLFGVAVGGWDEAVDGPLALGLLGIAFIGLPVGALMGAVMWVFSPRRAPKPPSEPLEPLKPPPQHVDQVWVRPVSRCEESARAVARLLGTLPDCAAADWLARIAETMTAKLAEIQVLGDAGQAAVPVFTKRDVARAKAHPLYAQLQKSADEFADVADQVGSVMIELHTPPDLELIRAQLQMLTQQLPLLR